MKDIKEKSIDAIIWNLLERYGLQFISLFIGVILARLLTPADYGLIGMINVLFLIAMVFVKSGLGHAYIQKKDADETDASTIFFFNVIVSFLFYILLWFSAPYIAKFYNQDPLASLIRVSAIILIINSFSMIQVSKLTKEVDFKKKSIISLISTVLSGCLAIVAAINNFGVWSLVIQQIAASLMNTIGLWFFYKWRPKMIFNMGSLKSMFSFSLWILLSSIIRTIFDNIYILTIGKFFPIAQLGFYTKAKGYQRVVTQQPSAAISAVSFPFFSKIQDNKEGLKNGMKKFMQYTLFLIAPVSAILIVISKPMVLLVLTEKWLPMVPYFEILLIVGCLFPIHLMNLTLLNAQGKSKLNFNLILITNLLRILNIFIMYRFGVLHIIYGELIISFLSIFINSYYTKEMINYGPLEQLKDIFKIVLISAIVIIIGRFCINMIANNYFKIIFGFIVSLILYFGLNYIINRVFLLEVILMLKSKFIKK